MLVLGGDVLGVELTEQLRLLGAHVTVSAIGGWLMPWHLNAHVFDHVRKAMGESDITLAMHSPRAHKLDERLMTACIGSSPDIALASDSGIAVGRGILVDGHLQTNIAGVFATGDVAVHRREVIAGPWHAAEYQGRLVGRSALASVGGKEGSGLESCRSGATSGKVAFDNAPFGMKREVFGVIILRLFMSLVTVPPLAVALGAVTMERTAMWGAHVWQVATVIMLFARASHWASDASTSAELPTTR